MDVKIASTERDSFRRVRKTLFPRTHRLRTARIRFPPDIPQRKQHFSCLRQMPVRQTQSGNHRTGPLSRRRTGQRTLFLRGGRRAVPTLAAEHLPGSSRRHRLADSHERQPRPLGRTGRAATQCRADGPGARSGLPRRTRLGKLSPMRSCGPSHSASKASFTCCGEVTPSAKAPSPIPSATASSKPSIPPRCRPTGDFSAANTFPGPTNICKASERHRFCGKHNNF